MLSTFHRKLASAPLRHHEPCGAVITRMATTVVTPDHMPGVSGQTVLSAALRTRKIVRFTISFMRRGLNLKVNEYVPSSEHTIEMSPRIDTSAASRRAPAAASAMVLCWCCAAYTMHPNDAPDVPGKKYHYMCF
jgi:hypothetical protein